MREQPAAGLSADEEQALLEKGLRRFSGTGANSGVGSKSGTGAESKSGAGANSGTGANSGAETVYRPKLTMVSEPQPMGGSGSRRTAFFRWAAAAVLIGLLVTAALVYQHRGSPPAIAYTSPLKAKEITTKYGTRRYQELPDGSRLWLNAGSKVQYADSFPDGKRELTLTGEAFFDIQHDPDRPFIIHAGKLDVKVLGTTLNVKAYPKDSVIETTLINGRAEIDLNDRSERIVLHPSEKVSISAIDRNTGDPGKATGGGKVYFKAILPDSTYGTIAETSWVEDKLFFRNERMEEVATRVERWYNINIRFDNNKYQQQLLTGYFKDQPVENVMKALQVILGFHYRIAGDTIHIW
jgi:ferric-dicitrate binding protein FerR (iron transport regulator)